MSLARHRNRASVLIAVLTAATAAAAIGATSAPAASMAVDCEGFQAALNQAGPGDVITLTEDCTQGDAGVTLPYNLPVRPSNQAPYTVQGSEDDAGIALDGNDVTQLLTGNGTGQVIIRNLTFQNGNAQDCPPEAEECAPAPDGGAISASGDSPLTIGEGNNFLSNHADDDGGAVFIDHTGSGAILVYDNVFGGEEEGNDADGSGGGLYVESNAPVTVGDDPDDETAGNFFESNTAGSGGGVAIVSQQSELPPPERGLVTGGLVSLENSSYVDNFAVVGGGAMVDVADSNAPVSMSGNEFGGPEDAGNFSLLGGGAQVSTNNTADVADNRFEGNGGLFFAGGLGLDTRGGGPTVTGNDFVGNQSGIGGGGMALGMCESGSVEGNTFESNRLDLSELQFPGGLERAAVRGTDMGARLLNRLPASREKIFADQLGAGLLAENACANGGQGRGSNGAGTLTQADNRFRQNSIAGSAFGPQRSGAGEFIGELALVSTNDRFVGNVVETNVAQDAYGGGLAIDLEFQQVATARNLVAAGNRIVIPSSENQTRGDEGEEPAGRGGGIGVGTSNNDSDLFVLDSTVEGNVAEEGSGIAGQDAELPNGARTLSPDDRLVLHNSIVYDNTGHDDDEGFAFDGEVFGFPERDVQFTDLCVEGSAHDDGDGSAPNSNVCTDPLLNGPVGDEDVDQTQQSPTIDAGSNELVPDDLGEDYEGNARITDGDRNGTATVDMGAHEFPGPTPVVSTPTPTQQAVGCVNAVGPVRGRSLGPARLRRTRTAQRAIFRGAQLRARPGMDKYCASPNGLFRLGYPTGRILNRLTRGVRRAVQNRVVLILTTSRGVTLSGVRPGVTRGSQVPRRLRRTRQRVGKNTWFVTRTRADVLLLIKVQGGLVREIGIGDGRLTRGSSRQLRRYLKTWQLLS